jgi:chromosome segregation ATPase
MDTSQETRQRASRLVDELRKKYAHERRELIRTVGDQVREVRVEHLQIANRQATTSHHLDALEERLGKIENVSLAKAELKPLLHESTEKLHAVFSHVRKTNEECELLKVALLNDRARREDAARGAALEDEELASRLSHLEESNARIRDALCETQELLVQSNEGAIDVAQRVARDAPTTHAAQSLSATHTRLLDEFDILRAEHATLRGRIESMTAFCAQEERRRETALRSLQEAVGSLEESQRIAQQRAPAVPDNPTPAPPSVPAAAVKKSEDVSLNDTRRSVLADLHNVRHSTRVVDGWQDTSRTEQIGVSPSLRDALARFYQTHNPAKLCDLNSILVEYAGAEDELFQALESRYGAFGYFARFFGSTL